MVGGAKPYLYNGNSVHWIDNSAAGGAYTPPTWNHDYTTQLEFRDVEPYFKLLGYPTILYQGERYTLRAFADVAGVTYHTLHLHVSHGAIGYKEVKWDYDHAEYREKVRVYVEEKRAEAIAREEAKEVRRKEVKEKLEFFKQVRASVRKERNHSIKKEVQFIPREREPGLIRWYLDGVLTPKDKIPPLIDMSLTMMESMIKSGNFTFRGKLVEIRYYQPPVKRPSAGRPKGVGIGVKNRITLFDGQPMIMAEIGKMIGMTKAQVKYKMKFGNFEKDGHKIEFAEGSIYSMRRPRKCIDNNTAIL